MAPIALYDIVLDGEQTSVGVFGCTPSASPTDSLLAKSQQFAEDGTVTLQLVDAGRIAGPRHLLIATYHALQAFHYGTQRAKTVGMEILRYAAAQRQITRALELFGVSRSTTQLGGILLGKPQDALRRLFKKLLSEIDAEDTPQVLEISTSTKARAIQRAFKISTTEIKAVLTATDHVSRFQVIARLVYERCALLSLEK
jgi:KEOPS complex subunit Cgi121